jgi:hypothetical protein
MLSHVLRRHRVDAAETWQKVLFCIVNHNELHLLLQVRLLKLLFLLGPRDVSSSYSSIWDKSLINVSTVEHPSRPYPGNKKKIQNTNTSNKSQDSNPSVHGVGTRINKYLHPASSSRPHYGTESGVNKATTSSFAIIRFISSSTPVSTRTSWFHESY